MSKRDFIFVGTDTGTTAANGILYKMYQTGKSNGLDSGENGGYATVGSAGLHASLSNDLSNSGTYYRAYNFMDDAAGDATERNWLGLAFMCTSSMSTLLNHASGTLFDAANRTSGKQARAAISLRAHLRLETSTGNHTGNAVGSEIGMFFGSSTPTIGQGNVNGTRTLTHLAGDKGHQVPQGHFLRNDNGAVTGSYTSYIQTDVGMRVPGYQVALSSLQKDSNHDGEVNATTFAQQGVRLLFTATPHFNYGNYNSDPAAEPAISRHLRPCAGTYTFNTWYRVRWDITIIQGCHIIEVYTATASDTIGSETWTKVLTDYVYACQAQFVSTIGANRSVYDNMKGMGYYCYSRTQATAASQGRHSAYIDNFQVLEEQLEAAQPNN